MKHSIIIMAKVPRAGNVKTRLQPFLSADECRALAHAFLFDTIEKARTCADSVVVAFAPAAEKDYFADLRDDEKIVLIEQRGADLGAKMNHAAAHVFRENPAAHVVIIGSDSPNFPPEFIAQAFENLANGADAVLGATADGGFYLLGLRANHAAIFDSVEWSSPRVYTQIRENMRRLNFKTAAIPDWFDVDYPADLRRLRDELTGDAAMRKIAPRTYEWFSNAPENKF